MANYRYSIITPSGKEKKGMIAANGRQHALETLRGAGNTVLSLDASGILDTQINLPFGNGRLKAREMSVFCRQFVTLLDAGISIVKALEMLEEQTASKLLKEAIRETKAGVEKGETLAGSMKKFDKVFPPMFINLVQAGEEAGKLDVSFGQMAVYYEKSAKLHNIVTKAMIYPIILSVVSVLVIIIMLTYIVPMYSTMFEGMGTELPFVTRAVMSSSDFVVRFWWLILIAMFLIFMGFKSFKATEQGRYLFDSAGLRVPFLGKLRKKTACAGLARNLSTLLGAGVSILDALEITARTMDNVVYRNALTAAREQVARGVLLSVPLQESGVFPPMIYHMVGIGEETGRMDEMLNKAADYYEEEVTAATEQAAAALEPLVILFMAFIVIIIIAAVFMPTISMYNGIDNL